MLAAFPMSNTEADCWITDMNDCQIMAEIIHKITTIANRMNAIRLMVMCVIIVHPQDSSAFEQLNLLIVRTGTVPR